MDNNMMCTTIHSDGTTEIKIMRFCLFYSPFYLLRSLSVLFIVPFRRCALMCAFIQFCHSFCRCSMSTFSQRYWRTQMGWVKKAMQLMHTASPGSSAEIATSPWIRSITQTIWHLLQSFCISIPFFFYRPHAVYVPLHPLFCHFRWNFLPLKTLK